MTVTFFLAGGISFIVSDFKEYVHVKYYSSRLILRLQSSLKTRMLVVIVFVLYGCKVKASHFTIAVKKAAWNGIVTKSVG